MLARRPSLFDAGTVLSDTWRLEEAIGGGHRATVYRARHTNGYPACLKVLRPDAARVEGRARLRREGRIASLVGRHNVVKVLDDGVTDDGRTFLVMDLVDGETLESLLAKRGRTLDLDLVAWVALEILDVLAAAHEAGIAHGAIDASHVMLRRDGSVCVVGFGRAELLGDREPMAWTQPWTDTTSSSMDLEDADLHAVGALMQRLLGGRVAFAEVVQRAMAVDPASRFASAHAMSTALVDAASDVLEREEPSRPPIDRRFVRVIVAISIATILAMLVLEHSR